MGDPTVTTVPGVWAVGAATLLAVFALYAASLDGVLTARDEGARMSAAAPLLEAARLMRQRRRTTVAADRLLWRVGAAGLIVVALLMVTVVPLGRW
ncbi:NADH dehydrogenase, partial [Mycobacterium intracellulare subsp. chimaera]